MAPCRNRDRRHPFLPAILGAVALVVCALPSLAQETSVSCGGKVFCEVAGGRYLALPPPDWNHRAALPGTIFFHGWRSSAAAFADEPSFTRAFAGSHRLG